MGGCLGHERGQVAPLLALLTVVVGLACLGLGRFGGWAVELAQARTAADAAALAGAAAGESAARRLAEANGARLTRFESAGTDVRVEATRASGASYHARARRDSPEPAARSTLAPALRATLVRAEELLGTPIIATVTSIHDRGRGVEVGAAVAEQLAPVAAGVGLCQPHPDSRPAHFELCARRLPAAASG